MTRLIDSTNSICLILDSIDMFRCTKRNTDSRETSDVTHLQFKREPNLS